jgi:carbamoyltransferase
VKDGYYLSAYIAIDSLSYLVDFATRGDQNISLWKITGSTVELVHYWELERFTGLKGHDRSFFDKEHAESVINELLSQYQLTLSDMVEVWGNPLLDSCQDYHSLLDYPEVSYHSIAHLFSGLLLDTELFYNSPILALAVDGGPDKVIDKDVENKKYYSGCYSNNGEIIDIFSICSPGPMWAASRALFGLREGSLMALASATKTEIENGQFNPSNAWDFNTAGVVSQETKSYANQLAELYEETDRNKKNYDHLFTDEENFRSMFMKEIDKKSIQIMENTIQDALDKYNIDPRESFLCMTGGYALNCPANSHLMSRFGFKGFIAPPNVNDGGISLGIALYAIWKKMNGSRFNYKLNNAYLGDSENISIDILMSKYGQFIEKIEESTTEQIVDDIISYPIAWFQGRAEIGPRALGNRSILGNPMNIETKNELNRIKDREWWRPVAPIILEEDLDNWFESAYPSPYMLHTFKLRNNKSELLPAIEHIDGSSRVQTVNQEQNPNIYDVLQCMKRKHGVPILCNTSLNDKGEPIINDIDGLMEFVLKKGMKVAYINGWRIQLTSHEQYQISKHAKRKFDHVNWLSEEEKVAWMERLNPFHVPKDQLAVYIYSPDIREKTDLTKKSDVRTLGMLTNMAKAKNPNIVYGGGCS